jgi:plastocyanin
MRNLNLSQTMRAFSTRLFVCVCMGALFGCNDVIEPIRSNPADQLWDVRVEPKAITMSTVAPYDTITLRTIVINGVGDTVTDGLTVQYSPVSDTSIRIGADGVLQVRMPTSAQGTKIVARVTYKNVTRTDTALVVVTTNAAPPYLLDSIVLETIDAVTRQPTEPIVSVNGDIVRNVSLVSHVFGNGTEVTTVPRSYVSSNKSVLLVNPWNGGLTPKLAGQARILATTTWYGKTYRTSLDISVVGPFFGRFLIQERIPRGSDTAVFVVNPGSVEVEPGAAVQWENQTSRPVEVIFDDPASARELTEPATITLDRLCLLAGRLCHVGKTAGNFSLSSGGGEGLDMRAFPNPGTYYFQVAPGVRGTIIVKSSLPNN